MRPVLGVPLHLVRVQVPLLVEPSPALAALERLLGLVQDAVLGQVAPRRQHLGANLAFKLGLRRQDDFLLGNIFMIVGCKRFVGLRHRPIDRVNNKLEIRPASAPDLKNLRKKRTKFQ